MLAMMDTTFEINSSVTKTLGREIEMPPRGGMRGRRWQMAVDEKKEKTGLAADNDEHSALKIPTGG
jgi:hypothetical protein